MKHPEYLQAGQTAPEEEFEPVNERKNQDKHRKITAVDLIQKHLKPFKPTIFLRSISKPLFHLTNPQGQRNTA